MRSDEAWKPSLCWLQTAAQFFRFSHHWFQQDLSDRIHLAVRIQQPSFASTSDRSFSILCHSNHRSKNVSLCFCRKVTSSKHTVANASPFLELKEWKAFARHHLRFLHSSISHREQTQTPAAAFKWNFTEVPPRKQLEQLCVQFKLPNPQFTTRESDAGFVILLLLLLHHFIVTIFSAFLFVACSFFSSF